MANRKRESNMEESARFVNVTEDITADQIDYVKLGSNLWSFMLHYTPEGPRPIFSPEVLLKLLQKSQEVLKKDAVVVRVKGPTVVFGPVYGEGDSLITLMSQAKKMPPDVTYVMLGCYLGHGFAQIECLVYVLVLKMLFPETTILLKGHHEESLSIERLNVKEWLYQRGIQEQVHLEEILIEMKKACSLMSAAAILDNKILCMPGGPGPTIRKRGLKSLIGLKKGIQAKHDKRLIMEAAWAVLLLNDSQVDVHGMPFFNAQQAAEFCRVNRLKCLIRGRQMVDDGFLNKPKEVITVISAVAYLDNFRNYAAVLSIEKDKATVVRYKMEEGEQLSLELVKPGIGRNATA